MIEHNEVRYFSTMRDFLNRVSFVSLILLLTAFVWNSTTVNAADWVPQLPVSIQLTDDFNEPNPFKNEKKAMKKQKLATLTAMRHVYRKLDKPTRKAQRNYEKYLGDLTAKMVKKHLPNLEVPAFLHSNDYVKAGNQIVLMPDEDYYTLFPESDSAIFVHHLHKSYLYLTEKMIAPEESKGVSPEGKWQLDVLPSSDQQLHLIFPERLPQLNFGEGVSELSGYSGCNVFTTSYGWNGTTLSIEPRLPITK